jgi:transcriptional regulator of arginine metabolism
MNTNGNGPTGHDHKQQRQRAIRDLIASRRVGSQREVVDALSAQGFDVTQATVSRDITELGLVKTTDPIGRPRYAAPDAAPRPDPREALRSILGQFGRRAVAAGNIVVLASEIGTAPAIGRALDRLEHPLVVGTLAGDDTILIVAGNEADARTLARVLGDLIG